MAGRGREDWFEREEFIGQISDIRVQNLQVEREGVQKRTFTRWMNLHLEKCKPPLQVQDLFQDIQDGHVLMALLEELSGCKLLNSFKKSSHRIFRLNNIAKVLSFLEERNVKLVSIDAADIADGNSSIILGLIWNIILFFQIKELTGNIRSQFPSTSSLSSIPTSSDSDASFSSTPSEEKPSAAAAMRENSKAIKKLLQWVQRRTRKYGVAVQDFGKSWTSGLAFLAVIKSIDSSLVDMRKALLRSPRENLEDAFRIAHYSLGIPRLLEPEDVTINAPDEQSIIMYVSQFLEHFPGIQESEESSQLIERSVSMGRLNFRDSDSDHLRNGAHLSRVRQCSSMFERSCTKPPPKVLISSVSEDRGALTPRLRVAAARSWSSEDFLTDSSHTEDVSSSVNVNPEDQASHDLKDSASDSPHPSYAPSPSSVPESLVGDSAINSPDSWVENELSNERFSEGHSDSSLWDSGNAWDVYRATPVDVTPVDEGFISSIEDRAPDDQSTTESYIDEGISSMDSNQEKIHKQAEKTQEKEVKENQEDLENPDQDLVADMTPDLRELDFTKHGEPSVTLCETDAPRSSGDECLLEADPESSTETPPLKEHDEDGKDQDRKLNGQTDFRFTSKEEAEGQESLNERADIPVEKQVEEPLKDYQHCEESSSSEAANEEETSKKDLNVPLISITSEPEEQEEELESGPGEPGEDLSQRGNSEVQSPPSPDVLKHENERLDGGHESSSEKNSVDNSDKSEVKQEGCSPGDDPQEDVTVRSSPPNSENQFVNTDSKDLSDGQQDTPTDAFVETETEWTQEDIPDPVDIQEDILGSGSSRLNGQIKASSPDPVGVSRHTDRFYFDLDRGSPTENLLGELAEPMDLFYPDTGEPMLPESHDAEMQKWPSVLSVSALQPAPASVGPEDLDLLGEPEDGYVTRGSDQNPADPSLSEDQCAVCGVAIGPQDPDVPADGGGSAEFLRTDTGSPGGPDEIHIPPVLRHRKGSRLSESSDKRRAAPRSAENQDSDMWCRESCELCVLLLLWLLLYSFMLLKQMDLKTLPGLLLNLQR
ncbi:calmin [Kryptolebias marmoratus]|uniref:calmin n=1 Tax=Kryptolebias marmoratus TaxID=37003 RepID=UPI0007F8E3FB|nr:calmin [Kryptolebias marmoratus]